MQNMGLFMDFKLVWLRQKRIIGKSGVKGKDDDK
jgi:hypothetical protein